MAKEMRGSGFQAVASGENGGVEWCSGVNQCFDLAHRVHNDGSAPTALAKPHATSHNDYLLVNHVENQSPLSCVVACFVSVSLKLASVLVRYRLRLWLGPVGCKLHAFSLPTSGARVPPWLCIAKSGERASTRKLLHPCTLCFYATRSISLDAKFTIPRSDTDRVIAPLPMSGNESRECCPSQDRVTRAISHIHDWYDSPTNKRPLFFR